MFIKQCLMGLILGLSVSVQAGLIAPDGNEWELRALSDDTLQGTWDEHAAAATFDTGWTWASLDDWNASGLNNLFLSSQADIDAFEGACNGTNAVCDGWLLSDLSVADAFSVECTGCLEFDPGFFLGADSWRLELSDKARTIYRASYQPSDVNVPEPATLALLSLGLIGLVTQRRAVR